MNPLVVAGGFLRPYLKHLLLVLYLMTVFVVALQRSYDAQSPTPFIEEIGVRLLSADVANMMMAEQIVANTPDGWFALKAPWLYKPYLFLMIFLNTWFIYKMFHLVRLGLRSVFSFLPGERSLPLGIVSGAFLYLFHLVTMLYVSGPPASVFGWFPFSGTVMALKTVSLYMGGAL